MLSNRRFRLIAVLFALVSLLFMQLAVAGYVCPATAGKVARTANTADSSMPCAESMLLGADDAQPNLCMAHCQADQQTADRYELPPLAALGAVPADFRTLQSLPNAALCIGGFLLMFWRLSWSFFFQSFGVLYLP